MKKLLTISLIFILFSVIIYYLIGFISSYIGWYGYKKWEYRIATKSIEESKSRNVFVKELNYQINDLNVNLPNFKPYIEYGFRYGKKSFKETKVIENTKFPFQLSFNNKSAIKTTIRIRENQLLKFDSCDASWGFLKKAELPDTIILDINIEGEKIQTGFIKVW